MQLPDLQHRVADFVQQNGIQAPLPHRLLDLTSEVGELSKEFLTGSSYGGQPFEKTEAWEQEVGDVFFSLVCVANRTGVDLEASILKTLAAYQQRIVDHGEPGSGS